MFVKAVPFVSSILNSIGSPIFCNIMKNLIGLQQFCTNTRWFLCNQVEILDQNQSSIATRTSGVENPSLDYCKSCGKLISSKSGQTIVQERVLSVKDADIVVKSLGLGGLCSEAEMFCNGKCIDCLVLESISCLLEKKEATMVELKEAFSVFDENRDGFIDAGELQMVMSSLELKEGLDLEECKKMIRAFDENGDGLIDIPFTLSSVFPLSRDFSPVVSPSISSSLPLPVSL